MGIIAFTNTYKNFRILWNAKDTWKSQKPQWHIEGLKQLEHSEEPKKRNFFSNMYEIKSLITQKRRTWENQKIWKQQRQLRGLKQLERSKERKKRQQQQQQEKTTNDI